MIERGYILCVLTAFHLWLCVSESSLSDSISKDNKLVTSYVSSHTKCIAPASLPSKSNFVANGRALYVRQILDGRLRTVLSGARALDFKRWAFRNDLNIISMHGVDESPNLHLKSKFSSEMAALKDRNKRNDFLLFSPNILDLSMSENKNFPKRQYFGTPLAKLEEKPASRFFLLLRSIRLGFSFAPIFCSSWLAMLSSKFREKVWFEWVSYSLAANGPAFIKWGQWASTRFDIFPEALCIALSRLHNSAPSHSWSHTRKVLESSLGLKKGTLLEVFDSFDEIPLASGSIAQVHKAVINGKPIVAKVRHPSVSKLIDMDFRIMNFAARIADYIPALSWLHIRDSVEQFSHTMAEQSHLQIEAYHLEVLNYNFRNWKQVKFPRPLYATSDVILETFEPGGIVTDILDYFDNVEEGTLSVEEVNEDTKDEKKKLNKPKKVATHEVIPINLAKFIVTIGQNTYLKMLLVDHQMHADLHPGNIMMDIVGNPVSSSKPESTSSASVSSIDEKMLKKDFCITLVDAGMVAQLSEEESRNFIGLLCSLGNGDGKVAAKCALRFTKELVLTPGEQKAFIEDMDLLFQERCRGYGSNVDVGHVLRGILGLIRKHKVRLDANYATLVINCLCIEGMSQRIFPRYNLLDACKPLLRSYQSLCYKRDGSPNENPSMLQKKLVRLSMPLASFRKSITDSIFFARQKRFLKERKSKLE